MSTFVPLSPRDLDLPADEWRPGQRETVQAVVDAFLGGAKYVMLSAPTGEGKSLVGAAVQKMLQRAGGASGGAALTLTHTIQLQGQYAETLPGAVIMTGRGNHPCDLPEDHEARIGFPDLTAEDAPCTDGKCPIAADMIGGCSYYDTLGRAKESPLVIANYAYALRALQNPRSPFKRTLLVADECHLAEKAIVEAAGVRLSTRTLADLGITLPSMATRQRVQEGPRTVKEYETTGVWAAWAKQALVVVGEECRVVSDKLENALRPPVNRDRVGDLRKKLKRLDTLRDGVRLLANLRPEQFGEWTVSRTMMFGRLTGVLVQPLYGWSVAEPRLWRHFEKVLLMSATPGDPEIEMQKLGIPPEECVFIERPSNFPVANRPVYFWPVARLSYNSSDEEWGRIADAIARIATSGTWAERKGLVHTGSKKNAARLVDLLNRRIVGGRFFTHGDKKGDAAAALEMFKRAPQPVVLVTASFTTGLDLPYLIGWQVIAKVPYGSLGDEITARRRAFKTADGVDFGQRVYRSEAMNTVVQAAGRIVRTKDDSGPTFILDGNYELLHRLAWKPRFYVEAFKRFSIAE